MKSTHVYIYVGKPLTLTVDLFVVLTTHPWACVMDVTLEQLVN